MPEKKTNYNSGIIAIVAIVAIVGIVVLLMNQGARTVTLPTESIYSKEENVAGQGRGAGTRIDTYCGGSSGCGLCGGVWMKLGFLGTNSYCSCGYAKSFWDCYDCCTQGPEAI